MTTKHTPAPWERIQECIMEPKSESYGREIANTCSSPHDYETRIANARLIAAAPDLLAAVEAFLADPDGVDPLAQARAAIAKARSSE